MASIGATADYVELRMVCRDFAGEEVTKIVTFGGTITDAIIEAFVEDFERVTNSRVMKASVVSTRIVSELVTAGKPANALERNVANQMLLTLQKANSINPSRYVERVFGVPAHLAAIQGSGGNPIYDVSVTPPVGNTPPEALRRIIDTLRDYLYFKPSEVAPGEVGGFVLVTDGGQAITLPSIIEGNPLT